MRISPPRTSLSIMREGTTVGLPTLAQQSLVSRSGLRESSTRPCGEASSFTQPAPLFTELALLVEGRFKTKEVCSVQSSIEPAASESALATVTIRSGVADLL